MSSAAHRAQVRAAMECTCTVCGGPCWGKYVSGRFRVAQRCIECVKRGRKRRSVQREGLHYQWGCP